MTQAPIHPRHKDMAAKAAGFDSWSAFDTISGIGWRMRKSILAHAQTLANDEAKGKALAEIDRIAVEAEWPNFNPYSPPYKIAAIAAEYRAPASDPVAEALKGVFPGDQEDTRENMAEAIRHALASRGLEIVERRDR